MIENMKSEITAVRKPRNRGSRPRQSLTLQKSSLLIPPQPDASHIILEDEDWSSATASDNDQPSPGFTSLASKSISRTPPSELETAIPAVATQEEKPRESIEMKETEAPKGSMLPPPRKDRSPSPLPPTRTPSPQRPPKATESDLADEILDSMAAASPSPKKPRHTLSLAERTRLSMSRNSHSQFS